MKTEQLFLPSRIRVGFKTQHDTYTGKLAYVIYYDNQGVLRKETSWQNWRDEKLEPQDFDNVPTEGFVLNKGVGGVRQSWGWNARNEYIRVLDPRGFEFEISVANLLFILREGDCSRGKGLEGKFVYAWDKNQLILLPVASQDYKKSTRYTALQGLKVQVKSLIRGATYTTSDQKLLTYLGRFKYYFQINIPDPDRPERPRRGVPKEPLKAPAKKAPPGSEWRQIFVDPKGEFHPLKDIKRIAQIESEDPNPNYSDLVDQYLKGPHGSRVVELVLKPSETPDKYDWDWYEEVEPGKFQWHTMRRYDPGAIVIDWQYQRSTYWVTPEGLAMRDLYGSVRHPQAPLHHYPHFYNSHYREQSRLTYREPKDNTLWARTELGGEFKVYGGTFISERSR